MINKKNNIEIEVLTPLSIGIGAENDWAKGIDYVASNGKAYILDLKKIAQEGIDVSRISDLFLNGDEAGVVNILGNKLTKVASKVFDLPASSPNPIKVMLRSELLDKPIIAGSSIKGALSSVLFSHFRTNETRPEDVFGSLKHGTTFMRFVKLSDFEFSSTQLVNTKIFNLMKTDGNWQGGWKHGARETSRNYSSTGFNTIYECLCPGEKAIGTLSLSPIQFRQSNQGNERYLEAKGDILKEDIRFLFGIVNAHTRRYLNKEKSFFTQFEAEKSSQILDCIDYLLDSIPDDNSSCLLKMSAGVGFHSITGDYQFDSYVDGALGRRNNRGALPKSRKIAVHNGNFDLMGFVKLTALSQDRFDARFDQLQQVHKDYFDGRLSKLREEETVIAEQLRKKEQLQHDFMQAISQARNYLQDNKFELALAEASKAIELCPYDNETRSLKKEIEVAQQQFMQRQMAEATASVLADEKARLEARDRLPLAERIANISSLGNLAGTIARWLKVDGNSFGETELNALVKFIPTNNRISSEVRNNRGLFVKIIGEDWTNELFNSLGI